VLGIGLFVKKDDGFAGPISFGNPVEVAIRELMETIVKPTKSRSEIVFNPLPADDPERRKPGIGAARAIGVGADHGSRQGPWANHRLLFTSTRAGRRG
jgi:hypothetical protein